MTDATAALVRRTHVRVRYAETDCMGVVYYANYFVWFEIGRTDWLRDTGHSYRAMEDEGIQLPVIAAWAITFLFTNLAWVLFRAPDLATARGVFAALAGGNGFGGVSFPPTHYTLVTLAIACVLAAMPRNSNRVVAEMTFGWPLQAATALLLAAGILSVGNPTEFLYFNF